MSESRYKILIVDDEPDNILLLEGALKGDYEVCSSLNGFDAIRDVKDQKPDLILLDIMMPDMNGFDVCRVIKADEAFSAIPLIFITAMDTIDAEEQGLAAGGIDFLAKPVNINLLKLRVRNHLELKHRNDLAREQRDLLIRQKEELKQILEEMEEQKRQRSKVENDYQTLFRLMLDGFALHEIICDAHGKPTDYRFLDVNPAFEQLTGLKVEEILGRTVLEVIPGIEQHWIEIYGNVALTGKPIKFENHAAELNKHFEVSAFQPAPGQFACIFVDITERKRAEEDLRNLSRRLQLATSSAKLGVWDWNVKDNVMVWDDQMLNLYGHTRQTFPGGVEAWQKGLHPDDREAAWEASQSALRGDCDWDHEFRILRPDGVVRWIKTNGEVIRDQDGSPIRMLGINRDITEQKSSEENLRNSEESNRIIIQTTMDGFWLISDDKRILDVNDAYCRMSGYSRQELVGMHVKDLEVIDSEEVIAERGKKIVESGGDCFESQHRRKDGSIFHIGVSINYLSLDGGQFAVFVRDITERKFAEIELRQSKAMLQAAMDCSPAGIAIADAPDGKVRYVNAVGLRMRDADLQSAIGIGIDEYVKRFKSFDLDGRELGMEEIPLARAVMFGETNNREFIIRRAESDDYIVLANAAPIWDESGTVQAGIVVFTDITEHRRIEEEKKRLESQLYQSQKMEAVGQLAGGVAHDFNNILTVIGGYSSLLQMDGSLRDEQKIRVAEIASACEKAAQLTHGLLAFSRKQPLIMKHENLNDIVQHVHKFLARIIGEDITLQSACCGAELPIVADRGQMEQVLVNLATNARDAMPGGGVFTVRSDRAVLDSSFTDFHNYDAPPGNYAVLTVSDTGTGISKEHIDHIFEPFFTTKDVGKGTGLGMAIIYGIIKQHNGFINVYSEPGHGTTFRIYLPIDEKANGFHTIETEPVPPVGGNETILVAEDEPSVRELVAKVLESHGYNVILAEDGADAVEKFKAHQDTIRLILMDMIMPKKNGKDAYEEISRIKPGVKLLFTSGYTSDFIENRGVSEEVVELIMKPVQPIELLRRVREILDK